MLTKHRRYFKMVVCLALASVIIDWASVANARIWSYECQQGFAKWKTKKKHKAFVVGHRGSEEYCGWSWGIRSKDEAIKRAIAECKRVGARSCTVRQAE